MKNTILYIGAIMPLLWGLSHLFPTKSIVSGFGDISQDNRHIITMEWIIEGVSLIFIGLLVALVTYIDSANSVSFYVYLISVLALLSLATVAFFTGFKIKFLPFRMCPIVLTTASIFILAGTFL